MWSFVQDAIIERPSYLTILVQGGFLAAVVSIFGLLHRSAISAYREIAKTYEQIADLERKKEG